MGNPDQNAVGGKVLKVIEYENSKVLKTEVGPFDFKVDVNVPKGCIGEKGDDIKLIEATQVSAFMELAGKCTKCPFYPYPCDKTSRYVTI